jgi:uncharacterized membrane protein YdjX (TVP38/TMEM64 family)
MGKIVKAAVFCLFAGAVLYGLLFTPLGAELLSPEGRRDLSLTIDRWVREAGPFGPALFILVYAAGTLFLPATPFTAAGALIFGRMAGPAYNLLGATLGACLAFVAGRYFLRGIAARLLSGRLAALERKACRNGFTVIFYLRLIWFPFIVLNYAAGATAIRFKDYFWGTLLGIAPAVVIVSVFFGSLREIAASYRKPGDLLQADVLVPAALLVVFIFLPAVIRRLRREPPLQDDCDSRPGLPGPVPEEGVAPRGPMRPGSKAPD